jgi:type II secretion system protein H
LEPVIRLHAPRRSGFTLIELLVVVAIIAVVAGSVAILAVPGEAAAAREEARRLAALLESAMRDARASGHSIAWSAEPHRYAFWQRGEDGDWVLYPPGSHYRSRALLESTELTNVRVDGRFIASGERVVFAPYGLRSELRATLTGGGAQFTIEGDVIGRVSLARVYAN